MRETTERPEGIAAGTARLVGTDKNRIVSAIFSLLDDDDSYSAMARARNPFGDGTAARKIAEIVARDHWYRPASYRPRPRLYRPAPPPADTAPGVPGHRWTRDRESDGR